MTVTVLQLDPKVVQADDNIRFKLKPEKVTALKDSILTEGGILEPVGVERLPKPVNGFTHRLIFGFYRHQSLAELNSEGAGLTLPAIELTRDDILSRLKTQAAENLQREDMSPMDRAILADKLLKEGMSRGDVRRLLATSGGSKGEMTPISNSMLNMLTRFLELPKAMQERIHDGRLGIQAAYLLGRVPPDKRQEVLDRAEEERLRFINTEEKDEDKLLKLQGKLDETVKAQTETEAAKEAAKQAVVDAEALLRQRQTELKEAQNTPMSDLDAAGQKQVTERISAAVTSEKGAKKLVKDTKNQYSKLLAKSKDTADTASELAKKLEDLRKAVKKRPVKAVGPADVKKAAKDVPGAEAAGQQALSLADIKDCLKQGAEQTQYPKVAAIFKHIQACFAGGPTPAQLVENLAIRVTMEKKVAPAAPAKK